MSTPETAEPLFMECPQKADGMDDMLLFGVQVQSRVYQRNSSADAVIPILAPDFVQRPVDVGPAPGFFCSSGNSDNCTTLSAGVSPLAFTDRLRTGSLPV